LFRIGINVDRSLRKLSVAAVQRKLRIERYRILTGQMEDAVSNYRTFLDNLFIRFQESVASSSSPTIYPHLESYKSLLRGIRQSGQPVIAKVSTYTGGQLFRLVRSTDLCAKICEEYAFLHLETAVLLRMEIQEQIHLLQLSEKDCSAEATAIAIEDRRQKKMKIRRTQAP